MEIWLQVLAWVLAYSTTCFGLANTGTGSSRLKEEKLVRKHTMMDNHLADDDPGGGTTPGETFVEVSSHGQLLDRQEEKPEETASANSVEKPKKAFYFQVHHESNDSTALMEEETEEFEEELDAGTEDLLEGSSDCEEYSTKPARRDVNGLGEGSVNNLMAFVPTEVNGEDEVRQGLSCANKQFEEYRFLTKWRLRTGATGDGPPNSREIRLDFKCCGYGKPLELLGNCNWWCAPGGPVLVKTDPRTDGCLGEAKYPPLDNHGSIMGLLRPIMGIDCSFMAKEGEIRGLVSWFMENTTWTKNGDRIRLRYYCCSMDMEADIKFTGEIHEISTDPSHKDDRISALTSHNVECPVGTAMSGWQMKVKDYTKFHIVARCLKLNGLPKIGGRKKCTWVGDPHFRCFGGECAHDPMTPSSGFYWLVKNDIIQIQGYYEGLDSRQPMRTKGVAFGGKFLSGCKVIVSHLTGRLAALNADKNYGRAESTQVCFCQGDCFKVGSSACKVATDIATHTESCGTVMNEDTQEEENVAETSITKAGSVVTVLMPLEVEFVVHHRTAQMDNTLWTPKLPGEWDGQCGNGDGNPTNDQDKGRDDSFLIGKECDCGVNCNMANKCYSDKVNEEVLFFGEYTGANGIGGGAGAGGINTLADCEKETLKEANTVCNMLFPKPAPDADKSEKGVRKLYHHMCLLDECNTKGEKDKEEIANDDQAASEIEQLDVDATKPRSYIPSRMEESASTSNVLCKTVYGKEFMIAKPTTAIENEVIVEQADYWANQHEPPEERLVSTKCLRIGIWKQKGNDGRDAWYWMPDYIPKTSPRCEHDRAWFCDGCEGTKDGYTGYIRDCLTKPEDGVGIPVSEAFDHLWAGTEANNQRVTGLADPAMDSVCVEKDDNGDAKWYAYAGNNHKTHSCTHEKMFGVLADSNAIMARSYCGHNKQLALMKSKHELSVAYATNLLNLDPHAASVELYIGGAFVETGWMWDDGTPVLNPPSDWMQNNIPMPDPPAENVFLCLVIPAYKLKDCLGTNPSDGHKPVTRNIVCESTHEDRPCPMSMYEWEKLANGPTHPDGGLLNAGAMRPLPLRSVRFQGRCYYIGQHAATCNAVCKDSIRSVTHEGGTRMGTCDPAGLKKIKTKLTCQMVVAKFKLPSDSWQDFAGMTMEEAGCLYYQNNKDIHVTAKLSQAPTLDKHTGELMSVADPDCDAMPDSGEHRVCSCSLDHLDFTGALGLGQMMEISGLNGPTFHGHQHKQETLLQEEEEAKKMREDLRARAGARGHGSDMEGSLQKKWRPIYVLGSTSTTEYQPYEDTTTTSPPNPLEGNFKIELIDASGSAGVSSEQANAADGTVLIESGKTLESFQSITIEAQPETQTIERCYHIVDNDGNDKGSECSTSTIWPFDSGSGASIDAWSVDLKMALESYEVYINGRRMPILDLPRLPSDFPTGVQLTGAYGGQVSILPLPETTGARYSYHPDNGCVKYEHKILGPVATWYFAFVADSLGGTQAIHGIPGTFTDNSNIYMFNGAMRVVIADNGPREIQFEYVFQTHRIYGVAIHYLKAERVLELYINTKRVEYQYFDHPADLNFPEGLVGCSEYETSSDQFLGKIWEFHFELKSPKFRPPHDQCANQHCEGPKWKNIENYATSFCTGSICNHTIDEEVCCEEMPLCRNNTGKYEGFHFNCEEGSDYRGDAYDIYCEDRACLEGGSSHCCAPMDKCSSVECGPVHVLIPDHEFTYCTRGQNLECYDQQENSSDFIKCCERVENCSVHTCQEGWTLKPHALSLTCKERLCTRENDEHTCCAPKGMCTLLRCPGEMQHRPSAHNTTCVDQFCDESSYDKCCMQEGRCDSIECPGKQILIAAATTTYCHGLECDRTENSRDIQLCCEDPAPCSWYAEEWCGQDYVHKIFHLEEHSTTSVHQGYGVLGHPVYEPPRCPGRVCRENEDRLACCEEKAKCDNKTCPLNMQYLPDYLDILCESINCDSTPDFKCCQSDASCSTFDCTAMGAYVLKTNHSKEHCVGVRCTEDDVDTCCDRTPICDTSICPASMVPSPEADTTYCEDKECTLNDKDRCCVKKATCDLFDCAALIIPKLKRHDAAYTLCASSDCRDTPPELCCVEVGNCLSVKCPHEEGLIHIETAGSTECYGGNCGNLTAAKEKCCETKDQCNTWTCPRRYNPKPNSGHLPCEELHCSHKDLHTCCQMEGFCINRTCPVGWTHLPNAYDTLCDDMACDPSITPEEKCCAEKGRCNSYKCPHAYIPKLNASKIDCSHYTCGDDDLDICCDNATECSHHECGEGMILRGDKADHYCKARECGGEDHEICCVQLGSCHSLKCDEGMMHIQNANLLCEDEFCNATDQTKCCEFKGKCSTYACPDGYIIRDPPDHEDCLEPECTDADRDRCCAPSGYCSDATFQCPDGMTPKVNHHNLMCPEDRCTTNDRLICCTFSDRCDSMQCPPGFLHRHDAYEISCDGDDCNKDEDHELCCVKEGNCWSTKCPEDYVHKDNATKIFCEDWKCQFEENSTDLDKCCTPRAPCNELQCNVESKREGLVPELVNRWDTYDHLCVNKTCDFSDERDDETCCNAAHMCSTFPCSDGLMHRHDANNRTCSDMNCTDTDEDLCCAAKDNCHTFMCPKAYVHWPDADIRECQGFMCDEKDRDTCCEHAQWCNAMTCPHGYTLKVDAPGRLCESAKCNEDEDLDHCCELAHTCESMICDDGWVHRIDAATRPCDDVNCVNTDVAWCCEERPHCYSDMACPSDWVQKEPIAGRQLRCESNHRNVDGELECTIQDMKEICCVQIEHCDQYDPPTGYMLKPMGFKVPCVSWKCSDVDLHTCAYELGHCSSYNCTRGLVHRHDAHHIMCQDRNCDATNEDVCCIEEGHCLSLKCDHNYIHREIILDQPRCAGEVCDDVHDHDTCCHKAPVCSDFICEGQGVVFSLRPHAENISCIHHPETQACNAKDQHTCCVENGMCSTYPCGDAMLHRYNAHEVLCHEADCATTEEDRCCAKMGFCPTYKCPPDMVHKNASETTQCRDDVCTDADKHYCCDLRATCENFKCPAGKVWRDPDNMHLLLCDGPFCENPRDDEICCKMEEACVSAQDCSYSSCEDGHQNFASMCATGNPVADGMRRGNYTDTPAAIAGECYQKRAGDFECMNQPCGYVPTNIASLLQLDSKAGREGNLREGKGGGGGGDFGENVWCCNGDLFRSCIAKSVVDGTWNDDVSGGQDSLKLRTQYETTTTNQEGVEAGARLSYIGCGLFENVKVATLFFGGLLALMPIATHVL